MIQLTRNDATLRRFFLRPHTIRKTSLHQVTSFTSRHTRPISHRAALHRLKTLIVRIRTQTGLRNAVVLKRVGVNNRRSKKKFHHPDQMTHCLRFIFRSMLTQHRSDFFGCHWRSSLCGRKDNEFSSLKARSNYVGAESLGRFNCHQIVIDEISSAIETESFEIKLRRRLGKRDSAFRTPVSSDHPPESRNLIANRRRQFSKFSITNPLQNFQHILLRNQLLE